MQSCVRSPACHTFRSLNFKASANQVDSNKPESCCTFVIARHSKRVSVHCCPLIRLFGNEKLQKLEDGLRRKKIQRTLFLVSIRACRVPLPIIDTSSFSRVKSSVAKASDMLASVTQENGIKYDTILLERIIS